MVISSSIGRRSPVSSVVKMINDNTFAALANYKLKSLPNEQQVRDTTRQSDEKKADEKDLVTTQGGLENTESIVQKAKSAEAMFAEKFWANVDEFLAQKTKQYSPLTEEQSDQKLRDELPSSLDKIESLLAHVALQEKYENLAKSEGISDVDRNYYKSLAAYHDRNSALFTTDSPEDAEFRRDALYDALKNGTNEEKVAALKSASEKLSDGGYYDYKLTKINLYEVLTNVSDKLWTDEFRALNGTMGDMTTSQKREALEGVLNSWKDIAADVGVKLDSYVPKSDGELAKYEPFANESERENIYQHAVNQTVLDNINNYTVYTDPVSIGNSLSGKTLDMYA